MRLAEELAKRRLLVRSPKNSYRLVHEAVIRNWSEARDALEVERKYLEIESEYLAQAKRWINLQPEVRKEYAQKCCSEMELPNIVSLLTEWYSTLYDTDIPEIDLNRKNVRDFFLEIVSQSSDPTKKLELIEKQNDENEAKKYVSPISIANSYRLLDTIANFLSEFPSAKVCQIY